ncbi:MAG: hypothetical protein AAFP03_08390 [Cyanobacteria bacterium J06598_3]
MDQIKKVSGYFFGFIGVVGLLSCVVTPFEAMPIDEKLEKIASDVVFGSVFTAAGGALIWSSQAKQRRAKAQALQAEQDRLRDVLYPLIKSSRGRFSLVDFAIAADIPAEEAKAYLEQQAMAFSANFDVSEQGTVLYQFPVS